MLRKTFSVLMLIVLLTGILTSTINIQPVKASGTIYIRSDGSIDPPTAPITTTDNVTYTFTGNINESIVVERNNTIINGADCTLQGTGSETGIYLSGRSNVTIKNTNIKNFTIGIHLDYSSNNMVYGNNMTNNTLHGVYLTSSSNNTISGNNITNNWYGVYLYSSSNNMVSGNTITNNEYGVYLHYSSNNNTFYHNNFIDNIQQVYSVGLMNVWDDGYPSGGNYWSNFTDVDLKSGPHQNESGSDGIYDHPYMMDVTNQDNYPLVCAYPILVPDIWPPEICVLSPKNTTYYSNSIALTFEVGSPTSWISFRLDNNDNVTIPGNTSLTNLADGCHNLVVYANDTSGNMGNSNEIFFSVGTRIPIIINESQTWFWDFIVNETDMVIIEDCNFTVEDGDIYVYGSLIVNNSKITIHKHTLTKYVNVWGELTFNNSELIGNSIISANQGAHAEILNSTVPYVVWFDSAVYIINSTVVEADGSRGCPAIIKNSVINSSDVCIEPSTFFSVQETTIGLVYIWTYTPHPYSAWNFEVRPGYIDEWVVSEPDIQLNITFLDSNVDKWWIDTVSWGGEMINLDLNNSIVDEFGFYVGNPPTNEYNLTLPSGFINNKNIFVDNNFNVTVTNSTLDRWYFHARHGTFEISNSNLSGAVQADSNMHIRNSTVGYFFTRGFHGNLTVYNVTADVLRFEIDSGSMDLVLKEGYQDFINFYNEAQGFNVTVVESLVNHWGLGCYGDSNVSIHNTTMTGFHSDVTPFAGLSILRNSTTFVYNSDIEGIRLSHWNPSLILTNSTVDTLWCYDNANFTAINSTIGTLITDPVTITLINSVIFGEIHLSLILGTDYISSSFLDETPTPLPSNVTHVSRFLHVATTYNDVLNAQIRLSYEESEIAALGVSEGSLRIYCLEEQSESWLLCPMQGINMIENYVWTNVTHFSYFVIGTAYDIDLLHVNTSKTIIGQGFMAEINVSITNRGSFTKAYNVTVYANSICIASQNVSLPSGNSTTAAFNWNTTGLAKGNYIITVKVISLTNETEIILVCSQAFVTIPGDIDGDRDVDIYDVVRITGIYGSKRGDPQFNPNSDLDDDGEIKIYDVVMCTSHYGQSW